MAFVYREERKTIEQRPQSSLGPGQYLPITQTRKIKPNKDAPFETKSQRLKSAAPNLNPGPGSYYTNDILLKQQKLLAHAQIRQMNQDSHLGQEQLTAPFDLKDTNKTKYILRQNQENLGFDIKDKRFKPFINENPGPGKYNTNIRAFSAKTPHMKSKLMQQGLQSARNKRDKSNGPSIPIKDDFGFDIDAEGRLIPLQDPDDYKHFKGDERDCVGPGSYQIDNPSQWHKQGPSWSKMKASRLDSANPMSRNGYDFNKERTFDTTRIKSGFSKDTTRPGTAFDMRIVSASSKKSPKFGNMSRIVSANREKRKNNNKCLLNENAHYKFDPYSMYYNDFEKFSHKQTPGPGYYIDIEKESTFQSHPYPENRQLFGSNSERFPQLKEVNDVGPATYFQGDDLNLFNIYKQNTQKGAPFSTKAQRFKTTRLERANLAFPGPGTYDPVIKTQIEKNHFNNGVTSFSLRQKRFDEKSSDIKWKLNTPGPGSYINPYTASGTANTIYLNGLYLEVRKGKEIIRKKSPETKAIHKNVEVMPDVGTYDPNKTMTIAYKAKKNANCYKGENVAFNTHKKKEKEVERSNLGPGFYYKEKVKGKEQVSPPFHQSDIKFRNKEQHSIGPGQYDPRSFFDWNKKTYNITFI